MGLISDFKFFEVRGLVKTQPILLKFILENSFIIHQLMKTQKNQNLKILIFDSPLYNIGITMARIGAAEQPKRVGLNFEVTCI